MKIVKKVNLINKIPIETSEGWFLNLKLSNILRVVCEFNEVTIPDVKNKISKKQEVIIAVREYCYLAWKLTNPYISLAKIGEEINRSHSMVIHHKNKILDWNDIKSYNLAEKFELIENNLIA